MKQIFIEDSKLYSITLRENLKNNKIKKKHGQRLKVNPLLVFNQFCLCIRIRMDSRFLLFVNL